MKLRMRHEIHSFDDIGASEGQPTKHVRETNRHRLSAYFVSTCKIFDKVLVVKEIDSLVWVNILFQEVPWHQQFCGKEIRFHFGRVDTL